MPKTWSVPDLDLLEDADEALLLLIGGRFARHRREPLLLRRRVLRNFLVGAREHRLVVGTDRADIGAAPAAGDHARAAQDALPEVEARLGAQELLARRCVVGFDDAIEVRGELREAVRRAVGVAGLPVAIPFAPGVGRAGLDAPAAARTQAQRLLYRLGAFHPHPAEHGGGGEPPGP